MQIGNYTIIEKIGQGNMGQVFKGHCKDNKEVVVKIISPDLLKNDRALIRFQREINQTLKLKHPNIVAGYTSGEYRKCLYYVMEYIEGTTIQKQLLSNGHYKEEKALNIILQIASALEYASQHGIIHRDIKPENIMLTFSNVAKLCDLGLAKSIGQEQENKCTIMGSVLGTPQYMSPEQTAGEDLDERSDIFSLGSTLYHMLTGNSAFKGHNPIDIMTKVQELEPVSIAEINPKISQETCFIVAKMMRKKREDRYQNFSQVIHALKKRMKAPIKEREICARFQKSYVPSYEDSLLAKIAVHNKVISSKDIENCLNQQEIFFILGAKFSLQDLLLEQKIIKTEQMPLLQKASINFMVEIVQKSFLKILGESLVKKIFQENAIESLVVSGRNLDYKKQRHIYAHVKNTLYNEEQKKILRVAKEHNIISKRQVERSWAIYSNAFVLGEYRSVGDILVEKNFLHLYDFHAILRAIRRNHITDIPIVEYLKEKLK